MAKCETCKGVGGVGWEDVRGHFHWDKCSCCTRDSDGSPEGRDPQGLDGEAATARAEGIAEKE